MYSFEPVIMLLPINKAYVFIHMCARQIDHTKDTRKVNNYYAVR